MDERATVAAGAAFWLLAVGHAVATWPVEAVLVVFVGGALAVAVVETAAIRLGLRRIHATHRVAGMPAWVPFVQPAGVYAAYRAGVVAFGGGLVASGFAAALVTFTALRTDPAGMATGLWSYPPSGVSALRYRGVPWWSFAARFVVALGLTLAVGAFV